MPRNLILVSLALGAMGLLLLVQPLSPIVAREAHAGSAHTPATLDVALTVKENVNVGASAYPVSVVIPLPKGQYASAANLGIVGVPSQVEVLERWAQDDTLRHVLVHFQPTVGAFGNAAYHFADSGRTDPPTPVTVTETASAITITTGPLKFIVSKTAFNILDQVWLDQNGNGAFESGERIIASHNQNGGVLVPRAEAGVAQFDAARPEISVVVEERGPLRAVIRVEALTQFVSTTQHTHGFAVRIYAYAGKSFVKVDYQLQNSAKNAVRSWPLYFEELNLDFRLSIAPNPTLRFGLGNGAAHQMSGSSGAYLAQEMHNRFKIYNLQTSATLYDSGALPNGTGSEGFVDVSDTTRGVMAAVRNFWQTWPNGLEVDSQNKLSLQLFPHWSAQWYDKQISPSGLYWLEDMQHVYKETLLYFHGASASDSELSNLARTFQFPPIAIVPTDWYRQTQATLDLGGIIPPASTIPAVPDQRQPIYPPKGSDPNDWYDASHDYYGAGWVNFFDPEPGYRTHACVAGGWPYHAADTIATGNPGDYFVAEGHGTSEVNLRPEWMAQYTHDANWITLQLTDNPYCGGRWRIFKGHGISKLAAPPLADTGGEWPVYYSRDDQHGWYYHVAEAYWLTGNPWLRDWYRFVAEFRRARLERLDPFPDRSSRATGHALNHALQAYRVAGDTTILTRFGSHLRTYLRADQDPYYGDQSLSVEGLGGGFQTGYLMRAIVDYLEEVRAKGDWQSYAEGFNYLSGLVEWNYNYGNFPYYFNARAGGTGVSNGTGLTLVDPQAWYYWHTGKQKYLNQIDQYMTTGINGGGTPYGKFTQWTGQFEARYYLFVKNTVRDDTTPPVAINNLTATRIGASTLLRWTAPADAARYHIVWSAKPIVASHSTSASVTNWWAANAVGPNLTPVPAAPQTLTINTGSATPVYVALFTFDQADNMSAMSNLASAVDGVNVFLPLVVK
jgi:hypothetical protein